MIAPARNTVAFDANGDTVNLPTDWFRAAGAALPQLVDPHEVLAISTVPLPAELGRAAVCVGDAPPARGLWRDGSRRRLDLAHRMDADSRAASKVSFPMWQRRTTGRHGSLPEQFVARDCVTRAFPRLVAKSLLFKDQGRVLRGLCRLWGKRLVKLPAGDLRHPRHSPVQRHLSRTVPRALASTAPSICLYRGERFCHDEGAELVILRAWVRTRSSSYSRW